MEYGGVDKFTVNSNGDLSLLKAVSYSWPSSQGGASTVLTNDGAGNLSWAAAGGGGTIGGSITSTQIAFGAVTANSIQGLAELTYLATGSGLTFGRAPATYVSGSPSISTITDGSTLSASGGSTSLTYRSIWLAPIISAASSATVTVDGILIAPIVSSTTSIGPTVNGLHIDIVYGAGATSAGGTGIYISHVNMTAATSGSASGITINNVSSKNIGAYGLQMSSVTSSGGATTYGISITSLNATGGGTTYGVYLASLSGGTVYGFYQSGASTLNYLNGDTGIGNTATTTSFLTLGVGTTAKSSLNVPHGAAPTTPVDGDIWTTTTAMYVRINGATVQLGAAGGGITGTLSNTQIAYGDSGANTVHGSANFTYDGSVVALTGTYASAASMLTLTGINSGAGQVNCLNVSLDASGSSTGNIYGANIAVTNAGGGSTTNWMAGLAISVTRVNNITQMYGLRVDANLLGTSGTFYGIYLAIPSSGSGTRFGFYQSGNVGINSYEARNTFSNSPNASQSALLFTGSWYTGGSATTTKPQLLIEPNSTTSTGWNTAGTGLGINATSGFVGNLIDCQVNGTSYFKVDNLGTAIVGGLADGAIGGNVSSWAAAGSLVINDNAWTTLNTNTSTIATFTLTMPSGPINGKVYTIVTAGAVTSLTLSPNAGQSINNAPPALLADTSVSFIYYNTVWYRLY